MQMKQKGLLLTCLLFTTVPALACITCDRRIRQGIFNSAFGQNVLVMILPFAVLGGIVVLLAKLSNRRYASRAVANAQTPVPLLSAALITGIGFGDFIDGILLHQILQWHEMISAKLPPTDYVNKSINMFWDGIFHAVAFAVTFVGVIQLWKLLHRTDIDRSGNLFAGGLIAGWGLFNVVEGIFDHHLLKLHNVREVTPDKATWNYGFLIFSVLLLIIGFALARVKNQKPKAI
jgi:uncharacterized membrane protein